MVYEDYIMDINIMKSPIRTSKGESLREVLIEASVNRTIGQLVDYLVAYQPKIIITGIDFGSGRSDVPLCIHVYGEWTYKE